MNLETKITIYKFTPQLFTLTRFGEYRTIQDYPIRGRATYLHVRKRKWLDKSSNEIFSYDWDLSEFDGTRLNSEFVSFLKEGD
jgi:transposase